MNVWSEWREAAACRGIDPELWSPYEYITAPNRRAAQQAARVCFTSCPVREECLLEAVERREPNSVWGGLTPQQRTRWRLAKTPEERREVVRLAMLGCGVLPMVPAQRSSPV